MYTSEQVIDLIDASYERGFSEGARHAYDTVAFLDSYEGATAGEIDAEPDGSEYDALYLEVTGQKVDDLAERMAGLERWIYATPVAASCTCGPGEACNLQACKGTPAENCSCSTCRSR